MRYDSVLYQSCDTIMYRLLAAKAVMRNPVDLTPVFADIAQHGAAQ